MALLAKVYFGDEIRMFELNERTVEEVSLKIHECFGMTREDVDMFYVNEGRPFAIKQTEDLILGLRLVDDDGPVHIKLVVKGEYRTMKGEKSVALDCKKRGGQLHNAAEAKRGRLLEEQAMELERQEREQEEERQRQRQETERCRLLEEQARELERQEREQEEEGQRQKAERRRLEELARELERQGRDQEEERQRQEAERHRLEEQARERERQEREQEEERQRQETERHRLEELARELERQGREQEEERQRQEAERRRLLLEEQARERERQEREQEEERQRQEAERRRAVMTPEAFHDHCKGGRAAEVAAVLEAACGDPERLRALLEHGDRTWTPLHDAAWNDHGEVVRLLLEAGADRDARYNAESTPMHWAAVKGHVEVVRLLLEAGADRDARTNAGQTPMYWAQNPHRFANKDGCAAIIEMLS